MNYAIRRIAFFVGVGLLIVSMYWSQDGFNFDVAGQSGYQTAAVVIGWFLAISVTCIEFVFSSNYRELNASLIFFGILAYAYSIYTNYEGILHFQGDSPSKMGAFILGVVMDGVPEPLIAWSLHESLSGDFIGNLIKAVFSSPERFSNKNQSNFGKNSHAFTSIDPELAKRLGRRSESDHPFQKIEKKDRHFHRNGD